MTKTSALLALLGSVTLVAGSALAGESGLSPNGNGGDHLQRTNPGVRGVALVTGRNVQGVIVHTGRVTQGAPATPGSGQPLPNLTSPW